MVFTQLLAMAESTIGEAKVDEVIDRCSLDSGGAYNAVGNYPCGEFVSLVREFSAETRTDVGTLQKAFGRWMFRNFVSNYPAFFENKSTAFELLESVEHEIHVEVRKLYPDAELPTFETALLDERSFEFVYRSPRGLVSFCHGLIDATLDHFSQKANVTCSQETKNGEVLARFLIQLCPEDAN